MLHQSGPTRRVNAMPGLTINRIRGATMALPPIIPTPPRVKDLTGRRFGRLTVLGLVGFHRETSGKRRPRFLCECDCGATHSALGTSLVAGMVKSCGCLVSEAARRNVVLANAASDALGRARFARHGMSRQPEHNAWQGMKQRCHNPRNKGYRHYGGRGIQVCERWRHSFDAFLEDMGLRPSDDHSLDRIDPDGNYEPGNVRWATLHDQANNRTDNHYVEFNGRRVSLAEAERLSGISQKVLWYRIHNQWPHDQLFTPVAKAAR